MAKSKQFDFILYSTELTAPPGEEETAPPPSTETGETMIADVRALIELAERQVVELGL